MADFIEGKRPVIEALRTHVPLKYILMADNLSQGDSHGARHPAQGEEPGRAY